MWHRVGLNLLRVEVSHLHQSAHGVDELLTIEEVAWTHIQFTTHHILIHAVVTTDNDLVDGGLLTFHDTHLKVDGVIVYVHLHRVEGVEQIAVIIIKVANSIIVAHQSLIKQLLVIHIALLHAQQVFQLSRRIDGVSHPRYIAQVVFLTFIHVNIHVHRSLVERRHAIFHNHGITIAQLVVLVDDELLISLEVLIRELLGTEDIHQLILLVGLLHHTLQLLGCDGLVALEGDLVHLDLFLLIDVHLYDDLILIVRVVYLQHFHLRILEALLVVVALYQSGGTVYGVWCHLSALDHADARLQLITFRLLGTHEPYLRSTRTQLQVDGKPHAVCRHLVFLYAHIREESMPPVALSCICDVIARDGHCLSYGQARDAQYDVVFIRISSFDPDASDGILLRLCIIKNHRCLPTVWLSRRLRKEGRSVTHHAHQCYQYSE